MRFPRAEFERRTRQARRDMAKRNLDILVVFSAPGSMRFGQRGHVLYLSGYEPYFGNSMMMFPLEDGLEPLLQIDEAKHFPSECTWIEDVRDPQDPLKTIRNYLSKAGLRRPRIGLVGEYSVNPALLRRIEQEFGISNVVRASDMLEDMRSVKSEYEIRCVRKACAIAKAGFEAAARFARPGRRDSQVVSEIERACREAGSEFFPHHTMFSSGRDTRYLEWWWYCGKRRLREKDTMTADFGTMFGAYCCDMARSFSVGPRSREHRDVYETIVEAERAGQRAARPGNLASQVDEAAAEVLTEFKEFVTTGESTDIGLGVGLEVHEWPFLGYHHIKNDPMYVDRVLKEDMVVSIEPQIYHPKFGLVQIEDQFRVASGGGKILSDLPREILEC